MKKLLCYLLFVICYLLFVSPVYAASASLSLSPASGSSAVGQEFTINVILNTGGGRTSGTDIYLNFDPNVLQALDVIPGALYDQYIGETINNTSGKVEISGLVNSNDNLYQGEGVFATIKFQGKSQGSSQVTFDFTAGNRNDTNVADFDTQGDILASATGGSYQITGEGGGGGPGPTATPRPTFGPTCTPTLPSQASPQPTPQLPVTAIRLPTLLVIGLSAFLFSLSFLLVF